MIIDCHSHILPGIDDGADNLSMSERMLSSLKESGIDKVVLTPHFYPAKQSAKEFLTERDKAFKALSGSRISQDFTFLLGAETSLPPMLFDYDELELLAIGGTRHILIEFPYEKRLNFPVMKNLETIVLNHNLIPIIAHIDRYPFLRDEENIRMLLDMGCLLQMNLDNLARAFSRKKLLEYIKKGYISMLGNDLHKDNFDNDMFGKTLSLIKKKAGSQALDRIYQISLDTLFN